MEIKIDDTTKAIIEMLVAEINKTSYRYSKAEVDRDTERMEKLNTEGELLGCLLRTACDIASIKYEHHTCRMVDVEFERYSLC